MVQLRRLKASDSDLENLAEQLNSSDWDDFGDKFSAESLRQFLQNDSHFYLVAIVGSKVAGALHAYILPHPAGHSVIYVDEVDTAKPYRRQGVATAMMEEMIRLGREYGVREVWLGTEDDNEPAKALYLKLQPYEVENGPIYSFKTKGVRK